MSVRELSWKARRRGNSYCAPACGRGCTIQEHDLAWERGRKLAQRLNQRMGHLGEWRVRVWENLGWHSSAVSECGRIKVHEAKAKPARYTAFLGDADSCGGKWAEGDGTPEGAVALAIAAGRAAVDYCQSLIEGLEES